MTSSSFSCLDLWDLWSSRIFSSISLFWVGANLHWLMWSRGRGWSGSWSPNSACGAQGRSWARFSDRDIRTCATLWVIDRGVPAACTSPAEHEWQMSKAVDRWPRRHAAADTTDICRRQKCAIETTCMKKSPQLDTLSPIPRDQHQLVNHISCRFPGCYISLRVRWFYQFSGITSCLTLIKAILWHNMSSYS